MKPMPREHQFEINIYWDVRDEIFVAEVPDLPGCAAHGDSRAEALLNAEVAISNWLKAAWEINHKIPKSKKRRVAA